MTTTFKPTKRPDVPTRRERARKMKAAFARRKRAGAGPQPAPAKTFQFVDLRLHEVRCIKTTKEINADEVSVIAVKAGAVANRAGRKNKLVAKASKGEQVSAGKFKKGDKRKFKARLLARFESGEGACDWPRNYLAVLTVVEEDEGKIGKVVNSVVELVGKQLTTATAGVASAASTAALAGVASGAALGTVVPFVGTAVGATVGAAVGLALGEIKKSHADDVFDPKKAALELDGFPDESGEIDGSRKTVSFKGFKGEYKVTYSWAVQD